MFSAEWAVPRGSQLHILLIIRARIAALGTCVGFMETQEPVVCQGRTELRLPALDAGIKVWITKGVQNMPISTSVGKGGVNPRTNVFRIQEGTTSLGVRKILRLS
jgi:hypothetical protein